MSYSGGGVVFRSGGEIELLEDSFDFTGIAGTAVALYGVTNSHLAGLDVSWTGEGKSGKGILLQSVSDSVFEDIVARDRTNAVEFGWGTIQDNIFRHNDFSHSDSWAIRQWYGSAPRNVFLDNDLSYSGGGVVFRSGSEIELLEDSFDFTGIAGTALYLVGITNSRISGLDVSWTGTGQSGTGIKLNSSSNITLEGITVADRATGISFEWFSNNITTQCTSILDNSTGVYADNSTSDITLNYNEIAGNSNGVANSGALLNAENNYWGAADGPTNLDGSGDSYTGNVDADPFLTRLPPCINAPPTADAGGPYEVIVGGTVPLDASGTTDPDQPAETLLYEWDLDGDGVFGETGEDAARGDETGVTPTFSAVGLAGLSSVTVTLRVTDEGDLSDEDTAEIDIIYVPDLSVSSSEIAFSPLNPDDGQTVTISATIANQGLEDAAGIDVSFFDFDTLIGQTTITSLAAGATADVSVQTSYPEASFRLITVKVDPADTIVELSEANNEASSVLQVGQPTTGAAAIVVSASPATGEPGRPTGVSGAAYYDFQEIDGQQDYPVQGAQVTVTVIDPVTSDVLSVFTGAHTSTSGAFGQGILAPAETGTYTLLVEIADQSATGQVQTTLAVEESETEPIVPPPSVPGGEVRDVFVVSENLHFSDDNPDLGEPITVFAFIQYVGAEPAEDVPVTVSDIFPVGGTLQEFQIGRVTVDFPASPDTSSYVTVSVPWANTAEGAHVIQVAAEPDFAQRTGNDRATRLIYVGDLPHLVTVDKSVSLAVDADGNSVPSPGDTLAYTISYANLADIPVNTGIILDDFDESLLQTPINISDGGTATDGGITWNLGTIAAEASGTVTYQVAIKPPAEFPGGMTTVVNTAVFDTDQTAPVAAIAQIVVMGDSIAPTTTAVVTPEPNAHGWNHTDADLILIAMDNDGGSGVREIAYSIDGGPATTVPGATVTLNFTDEGIYTVAYHAVDVALNVEGTQTIKVKIDRTAPVPVHGGPFSVDEGDSIQLIGTGSSDALSGILSTAWSLDGDGLFNDGDPATFIAQDGPSTHAVFFQVTDKAGNVAIVDTQVDVQNVDPTLTLDMSEMIDFNGGPAFLGRVGVQQHHTATATDAGSDDLTFSWRFGSTTTYTNDEGVFPFSATDVANITFDGPGVYELEVTVTDDDGGSNSVTFTKVVTNNETDAKTLGFWRHQFRDKGHHQVDDTTLDSYLDIVNFASAVFSEDVVLATFDDAQDVLQPGGADVGDPHPSNMKGKATGQSLAAWLNFASGAVGWDETVPTTQPLWQAMGQVEDILLHPDSNHPDYVLANDIATSINEMDEAGSTESADDFFSVLGGTASSEADDENSNADESGVLAGLATDDLLSDKDLTADIAKNQKGKGSKR